MTPRNEVYTVIDGERDYQDSRWNVDTTTSEGIHTPTQWLVYIEDYLNEAKTFASRRPEQEANPLIMANLRKIAGMTVCAMEQNGAPAR